MEGILEIESLGNGTGTTEFKRWKKKNSSIEDMIEEIDSSVKENAKSKIFLRQNIQETHWVILHSLKTWGSA